jgi:hypothetical protein
VQAITVLKHLQRITSGGRYLFPHRSGKGFTTPNRLIYAMRDMTPGLGHDAALLADDLFDLG